MTEAKTGRHPLDQIRRTIRQKLLTPIRSTIHTQAAAWAAAIRARKWPIPPST